MCSILYAVSLKLFYAYSTVSAVILRTMTIGGKNRALRVGNESFMEGFIQKKVDFDTSCRGFTLLFGNMKIGGLPLSLRQEIHKTFPLPIKCSSKDLFLTNGVESSQVMLLIQNICLFV